MDIPLIVNKIGVAFLTKEVCLMLIKIFHKSNRTTQVALVTGAILLLVGGLIQLVI